MTAQKTTQPAPSTTEPTSFSGRRPTLTYREHLLACALATWMLTGLYLDGWAHRNLNLHDSIETPWHAVLYSGWTAFALFYLMLFRRYRAIRLRDTRLPAGYGVGFIGVMSFAIGGFFDQFWHLAWGVEQDLNAFFSPTHWLLAIGMFLMVSSPLRAYWLARTSRRVDNRLEFLPALWSILLTLAMCNFTTHYLSTFISDLPTMEPGFKFVLGPNVPPGFVHFTIDRLRGLAVADIILTTSFYMGIALHVIRRWHMPFGSFTLVFTAAAAAVNAIWEYPFGWVVIAGTIGGLTADLLVHYIDPRPGRLSQYRIFAGVVPFVMWYSYYAIWRVAYSIHWPIELWSGSVWIATLASLLLSYVMAPGGGTGPWAPEMDSEAELVEIPPTATPLSASK